MSECFKENCNQPTVEARPVGGKSISLRQMYCEEHLKEAEESGEFSPVQFPVPEK